MTSGILAGRSRPATATLVAGVFVLAGFLLTGISWGFLAVSAVAMFLPGILRELGVLRDKDELQLEAMRRAGHHAYLAGGLFTFLMVAWFRAGEREISHPGALVENTLVIMWFTWLFSSLFAYWGRVKTATRVLWTFGGVWLVFNIMAGEGDWKISAMQSLLAVPFLAAAWLGGRFPRVIGGLLLVASGFFFWFFGLAEVFSGDPTAMGRVVVIVLFIGPLAASGLALVQGKEQD